MNHVNMRLRLARIPYTHGLPDQLVSSLVWNGQQGVQIFFAVSGFLITSTAIRHWGDRTPIRDFYRLRFARIAPLLLALLAILSVLHLAQVKNFVINPKVATLPKALFAALTFNVNVLEAQHGYLPANWDILWSLSVEEVFYFCFPLVRRYKPLFIAALLILIALGPYARTHGNPVWREYSYLGGMDAIALGCLTATLVNVKLNPRILTILGSALLIFTLCFYQQGMTLIAIGTCLICAAAPSTPRILNPLLRLGQRSYEVYLTHMFIVFLFFDLFLKLGIPVPLLFLATILVSGLVGEAVARLYSEPLNLKLRAK